MAKQLHEPTQDLRYGWPVREETRSQHVDAELRRLRMTCEILTDAVAALALAIDPIPGEDSATASQRQHRAAQAARQLLVSLRNGTVQPG